MRVVQINATCGSGSTGKICKSISECLTAKGIENYILYASGTSDYELGVKYSTHRYIGMQSLLAHVSGDWGFLSPFSTKKLLKKLEDIRPDVVHLHNIHGHDCNIETLLKYLKEKKIKVFWTFHDCWAFTGYCTYFTYVKCDKWQKSCGECPQKKRYSWFFDKSETLLNRKKVLLSGMNLTIISPSQWLADLVKQSFLRDYPTIVINNGIDLDVFKPTESQFRNRNDLAGKKIVLGVAFGWEKRKGLDVFIELSKRLTESYQIVLVGTDNSVDRQLPANIISIHRTQNQSELAGLYTVADVLVNPTREDNFPTVNMEAIACGTPVITFRTGGSPECVNKTSGSVVEYNDIDAMENEIYRVCESSPYSVQNCLESAKAFESQKCFDKYVSLYDEQRN